MAERQPNPGLSDQQFGLIVRELCGPLVLYARQWSRYPEDIVQEALLLLQLESQLPANPRAWLFRVVRHRALNDTRSEQRRRKHEAQFSQQKNNWFEATDHRLEADEAVAALQDLPAEIRETIIARLWGELTLEEIAELMNTSLSTAQRRFVRGLQQLRQALEPEPKPLNVYRRLP